MNGFIDGFYGSGDMLHKENYRELDHLKKTSHVFSTRDEMRMRRKHT